MLVAFTLSMPNVGSWNGNWTGRDSLYARVVNFGQSKKGCLKASSILEQGPFSYSFGDGWAVRVTVRQVDAKEAARIRRLSKGFCGYDWMVESLKENGRIST